ncbi:hypothetical protein OG455_27140 [Kitasatospora sp. NBC_01287]|uniref:hypothetical protein n=1 Tax=Kitasatospora sp. NBC_01287 TaxID=2903573 RepID=UPI002253092A|nr:hypothetical protein [Kitasatospora sp. NBC_01287]MCX4749139.1 hypothetical protein [Kitasatospora sp. NBC_01287]
MPRPDWRHMPASAWYGQGNGRQDSLFDPPGADPDEDAFGTTPFEGCTSEELFGDLEPPLVWG